MERLEGSFLSFDETELFFQVWRPEQDSRGFIVLTHGMGEHSECYNQLATDLVQDQWTVYSWDLRGHGRSEGKRGYVREYSDMVQDLKCFLDHFKKQEKSPANSFLLGHSLGGLILLSFLVTEDVIGFRAAICSAPALGISVPIPKLKEKGAELLADWLPKLTLHNGIVYQDLHKDVSRLKQYAADPLRHDKVSSKLFIGMQAAMNEVQEKAEEIQTPILFQLAGDERIVSTPAAEDIFAKIGSKFKKIYIYPDSLHEIYNDLDRDEVIRDLKAFLQDNEERNS